MALVFVNFKQQRIVLNNEAYEHITEAHPEVTLDLIKMTLEDPDEE